MFLVRFYKPKIAIIEYKSVKSSCKGYLSSSPNADKRIELCSQVDPHPDWMRFNVLVVEMLFLIELLRS